MKDRFTDFFSRIEWWLVASSACLSGFGLVIIHSLTWPENTRFGKQLVFFIVAIGIAIGIQVLDAHFWRNASLLFYIVIVIILLSLVMFGEATRGIHGWLMIGPFGFQQSDFAQISTILFLATTLERLRFDLAKISHVALALGIIGLPVGLTALQPDLGSAFIIFLAGAIMVLYTGLDKKKIITLILACAVIVAGAWFFGLRDYQKERILSFLNPQSDPLGSGYNVAQSIVAIGSGGIFGKGLGLGTQSQLNFLPEQETDFIFASIAEETGFTGSLLLIILYLFFLWRLYLILIH